MEWVKSIGAPGARTAPRPPKKSSATIGAMSAWLSSPRGRSQVNIQFIMPNSSIVAGRCNSAVRKPRGGARQNASVPSLTDSLTD